MSGYHKYRRDESTCGGCGKPTYRSTHDHFPECSHGCAEWLVDKHQEEKHHDNDGGWNTNW